MPSPDASAPTRCCVQGREAVLVGARTGIELGLGLSPSCVTDLRRRPCREPQVYSRSGRSTIAIA